MSFAAFLITQIFGDIYSTNLCRCNDVGFGNSAVYGTNSTYHNLYHTDGKKPCAGDDLYEGALMICESTGEVQVKLVTNHDWNLYTLFWLPIGGDPVADKTFLGELYTEINGTADWKMVRDGGNGDVGDTTVDDLQDSSNNIDFRSIVGSNLNAGNFLIYSRGPITNDNDGGGWNTNNGQSSGIVNNPELWGSMPDGGYAGVQFINCVY